MNRDGKRLLSLALACLLCWMAPAQALAAGGAESAAQTEAAQLESTKQPEGNDSVSDSDILADAVTPLIGEESVEELLVIEDADGRVYQEGGFGAPAIEAYGIAAYAEEIPQEEIKGKILAALRAGEASLDISEYGVSRDEIGDLFHDVINENPSLFYVDNSCSFWSNPSSGIVTKIDFSYKAVTDAQKQEFERKVNEAVALVTDEMSDVEKALVLHDYLAQHCAYAYAEYLAKTLDSCPNVYDAYGALVNGKAVCQGYALAYVELLKRVGIQSYICSSSEVMNHAWNVVLIDGAWYHVDVTWDDPTWNREGRACHEYFLLSDTEMANRKHSDWVDNVECNSSKYDDASYWWRKVDSQIVQVGHDDYIYVKDVNGKFQLVRRTNGAETVIYNNDSSWNVWGQELSYYTTAYAFLSRQNDTIYFNDKLNVYSMNLDSAELDSAEIKKVYTYGENDGYIYGAMVYEDGKARLNLFKAPDAEADTYREVELVKVIRVTGVILSQSTASLKVGETLKLTATVAPENADNKKVQWSSTDPSVASVGEDGTVTAVKEGTATIKVTTADGGKTASCAITVTCSHALTATAAKEPTCAEEGNIAYWTCSKCNKTFSDAAGTTELTEVTVKAKGHTPEAWNHDDTQHWRKCKDCNVEIDKGNHDFHEVVDKEATEDETGLKHEECDCGAKRNENTVIPKIDVSVTGVALNKTAVSLAEDSTLQLTATVTPANADNKAVEWSSSVPTVASVGADGTVTAVKEGTTVITVTTKDGKKTARCTVTVTHAHNMTHIAKVEPDCVTPGKVEHYSCSKCGKNYSDAAGTVEIAKVTVEATGHTPGAWNHDDTQHWRKCKDCNVEIDRADHVFRVVVDREATEDETGLGHEQCECGETGSENIVIPKLDHTHIDIRHHEAVPATCVSTGSVEYWICSSAKCAGKYYGDSACQAELSTIEEPVNASNHIGTGYWSSTSEKHTFYCACGVAVIDGTHIYDNDMDSTCNLCVYRRFYVVTDGVDATYEAGSESGLTITTDGVYKFFQAVEVDGRIVDAANYEVREGSTIITLKKDYLESLPVGTHDIRVLYTDGKVAATKFTIQEADDDDDDNDDNNDITATASSDAPKALSPKTGDTHQPAQSAVVMVICIFMIAGIMIYKRKTKKPRIV
ncbi:MAG: Ig-like domain-containing protein [Lachnoclostridium sp.]|nr:Ig-like domain-containing protein [Lachnospira sp.]MCM1248439.1 Ig-like domain-containing protein [Lachnoclostridium sp.]